MLYLDHAATSWPKPPAVVRAVAEALTGLTANAGRSGHRPSTDAARLVFQARARAAKLLGVAAAENLVVTRGATEGLNLVLKGFLHEGDRVAVSPLEHNSVMRPLSRLAAERAVVVETLPADPLGRLDLDGVRRLVRRQRFALAVVAHASNVNGVVQDLAGLCAALDDVPLLVDGAQTAGVLPLDLPGLGIDFFACSAHKGLLGPMGVGLCYLRPGLDVQPLLEGGTGSRSESWEQPATRPDRYESGTLNLHGIAGLGAALAGLPERGLGGDHQRHLATLLLEGLADCPGVHLQSPRDGTALCISLTLDGRWPEEVALRLEREHGILCRPGLHCAPAAHRHLGTFPAGSLRLSPGWGNTVDEIEATIAAIRLA